MAPIWDIDPVFFHLPFLGWPVRYYGLIFGLIIIGGFFLFRWQVLRGGGTEDNAFDIVLPGVLGIVVGARLAEVFFYNFDRFKADPAWLFRVWEGGLASHGAFGGMLLAILYYSWRHKKFFFDTCDRLTFSCALGGVMIRLANFFNSEVVGKITSGPFGVRFPQYDQLPPELTPARYPSQLVESGLGLLVLAALLWLDARLGREKRPRGVLAAAFLILYFIGRFLVEFVKERHGAIDNFILSRGQLLSLPGLALGLIFLYFALKKRSVKE